MREGVRRYSRLFLRNSIIRMKNLVAPELQQDARKMLCEYWGEGFVEKVEKAIEEAQAASEAGEGKWNSSYDILFFGGEFFFWKHRQIRGIFCYIYRQIRGIFCCIHRQIRGIFLTSMLESNWWG